VTATVFLIRHGAHPLLGRTLCGRAPGVGLGEDGRAQAESIAARLGAAGVQAVYSSPLERARETAGPLARRLGAAVQVEEDLDELDFGEWTGRSFESLEPEPLWGRWNAERLSCRPPGGESFQEAQARIARFLQRMADRGGVVAAVSHADMIKAALAHALGLPLERHDRFEISPGSVSVLVAGGWGMKVHSMNEVLP